MLRLGQQREELKIVNDQCGAPTSALALAGATRRILERSPKVQSQQSSGIYHMSCAGETTWCGFAQTIFQKSRAEKPWASVTGIPSSEYPAPARRPANSVLSNKKLLETFGVELPHWEAALDLTLSRLKSRDRAA